MLEVGGYLSTAYPPAPVSLIDAAYREWVWETECNWVVNGSLTTTASTAVYTLPSPEWKHVKIVRCDEVILEKSDAVTLRTDNPRFAVADTGTPRYFWRDNVRDIRLYPAPDTTGWTIQVYGMQAPAPLSDDTSTPYLVPEVNHRDLCVRAANLHKQRFAVGEELEKLLIAERAYQKRLSQFRREFLGTRSTGDIDRGWPSVSSVCL